MISVVSRMLPSLVFLLSLWVLLGPENKVLLETGERSTSRPALVQTTFPGGQWPAGLEGLPDLRTLGN